MELSTCFSRITLVVMQQPLCHKMQKCMLCLLAVLCSWPMTDHPENKAPSLTPGRRRMAEARAKAGANAGPGRRLLNESRSTGPAKLLQVRIEYPAGHLYAKVVDAAAEGVSHRQLACMRHILLQRASWVACL